MRSDDAADGTGAPHFIEEVVGDTVAIRRCRVDAFSSEEIWRSPSLVAFEAMRPRSSAQAAHYDEHQPLRDGFEAVAHSCHFPTTYFSVF